MLCCNFQTCGFACQGECLTALNWNKKWKTRQAYSNAQSKISLITTSTHRLRMDCLNKIRFRQQLKEVWKEILESALSSWATPILLVKKQWINNWRMLGDYWWLRMIRPAPNVSNPRNPTGITRLFVHSDWIMPGIIPALNQKERTPETDTNQSVRNIPVHPATVRWAFCRLVCSPR